MKIINAEELVKLENTAKRLARMGLGSFETKREQLIRDFFRVKLDLYKQEAEKQLSKLIKLKEVAF